MSGKNLIEVKGSSKPSWVLHNQDYVFMISHDEYGNELPLKATIYVFSYWVNFAFFAAREDVIEKDPWVILNNDYPKPQIQFTGILFRRDIKPMLASSKIIIAPPLRKGEWRNYYILREVLHPMSEMMDILAIDANSVPRS